MARASGTGSGIESATVIPFTKASACGNDFLIVEGIHTPSDIAAFTPNAPGTFGNAGRNALIGPKFFTLDFSAHKEFPMPYKDGHLLQFRFEAFNALNRTRFGNPAASLASGTTFGKITSASGQRNGQVAAKITI